MDISQYMVCVIPLIFFVIFWLKKCYSFWEDKGVKTPPYLYFFGNLYEVLRHRETLPELLVNIYKYLKSKNIPHGGIYTFFTPIYIPADIKIVHSILQADSEHFMSRGIYYNQKDDPLGAHLGAIDGQRWEYLRATFTPTFTPVQLKTMLETFLDCANNMKNALEKLNGKCVDTEDLVSRFSTDVIARCALGIECNSFEKNGDELHKKVGAFFNRTLMENLKLFFADCFPKLMKTLHVRVNRPEVSDFIMNLVREVVEYREKNNVYRKDFMHSMIQLKNRGKLEDDGKLFSDDVTNDEEKKITFEEMCAQAYVFFLGGYESASTTISFCFYLLSSHKKIQDEVRTEIREILEKNGGKIDYEAIQKMVLLEKVIKETMRLFPPVPYLIRMCSKEYKIPNTDLILKEGQRILIPSWGIQKDEEFYPDPEKFDPERFSEENSKNRKSSTYLPSGEGPRMCIGPRFGSLQIKIGLITFLRNYEISLNKKTIDPLEVVTRNAFMLTPKGGIWLDFKRID